MREVLEAAARPTDAVEGVRDERTPIQRLADALVETVTITGPLDLDDDPGMTHPGSDNPDDTADSPTEDDVERGVDDEADDGAYADCAADEDDPDTQDHGDIDDIDSVGGVHPVLDGQPVLDFGDGFTFGFNPAELPPTGHGAAGGGCRPGANRRERRAHRGTSPGGWAAGAAPMPTATARPGVTLSVIINWDTLTAGLSAAGTLPDGATLSPAATLAALCDAGIIPMIFNGPGRPLHVGRYRREFTGAQRRALAARDRGCTFPGCHRRASACAAHHLQHWEHGGETGIANGALLCRYHHQMLHREGWEGRLDAKGRPEYRPPAALDPERKPRQHLRFAQTTTAA